MANRLELGRLSVTYDGLMAVNNVFLKLPAGQIGCLVGPSGCGKTSVLRTIAGFERVAHGGIHIDGARVGSRKSHIPPDLRGVGMVFSDYALFPHLTVGQNLAFGLGRLGSAEADNRKEEILQRVGLKDLRGVEKRYPHHLTLEQAFRVALGRAIAPNPRLLLLDEPFARLDRDLQERLPLETRDILKEMGMTALVATHDQHQALAMADMIGVMVGGRLLQWGDVETIYNRPSNRFVASFIGQGTILHAQTTPDLGIVTEIGYLPLPEGGASPALLERPRLEILVRPQQIKMLPLDANNADIANAEVVRKTYQGMDTLYTLRLASGTEILAFAEEGRSYRLGDKVLAVLKPHNPSILYMGE